MSMAKPRNPRSAEVVSLVNAWSELRWGRPVRWAGEKEYDFAKALVSEFGIEACLKIMPFAVELTAKGWPEGQRITAVASYWDDAVKLMEAEERRALARHSAAVQGQRRETEENQRRVEEDAQMATLRATWDRLRPEEREEIEQVVQKRCYFLPTRSVLYLSECLRELKQRTGGTA